jgi:hypothetical protein
VIAANGFHGHPLSSPAAPVSASPASSRAADACPTLALLLERH